jgi:SulP family sulfate permease
MKKFFPFLDWLPTYNKTLLGGDLNAGLTVGVMLIPQGMAYAMLAGLPPIYGLYASIIPLIIYALLGTSRQLAVGPVAMVALLVAAGTGSLAEPGSQDYIALTLLLALMVGIFQLSLGLFKMGFLVNFMSHPVISGFTSAAAIIIGFSQLKHLLGLSLSNSNYIHEIIVELLGKLNDIHWMSFAIGLGGILLIIGIRKINRKIPGSLLAVAAGILIVWLFKLDSLGVKIVQDVPAGLPALSIPAFSWELITKLWPVALTISLVGFMESIAIAKAMQSRHRTYKVDANQELIALGTANIAGSFFSSFPTTGGFSRTAVNDQSGANTGMASIISAVLVTITLLFLTPLFYYLPNAILASIILVAVSGLIDFKEVKHLWQADRRDFSLLIITFLGTLALGIEEGIIIGVVLSLGMMIFQTSRPHFAIQGKMPGTTLYKNTERFTEAEIRPDILIFRLDARLYFANAQFFKDNVEEHILAKGSELKLLIINAESINSIDSSGIHTLQDILLFCKTRGIKMIINGVKGPVRDSLYRSGFTAELGEENFFLTVNGAVTAFDANENPKLVSITMQNGHSSQIQPIFES